MRGSLDDFHANKDIFVQLGICKDFKIPKLHSLQHYMTSIELYGTTDNYDTMYTKRLHIDMAKDVYHASNKKDEFTQMTTWLSRKEKIQCHSLFIQWRLSGHPDVSLIAPTEIPRHMHIKLAHYASRKSVLLHDLVNHYGAVHFVRELLHFAISYINPDFTITQVNRVANLLHMPLHSVPTYFKLKFWNSDPQGRSDAGDTLDAMYVRSAYRDTRGQHVEGHFDMVLVRKTEDNDGTDGVVGMLQKNSLSASKSFHNHRLTSCTSTGCLSHSKNTPCLDLSNAHQCTIICSLC